MEDEAGMDAKVLAVPSTKLKPSFDSVNGLADVDDFLLNQISHFFEHYKDLEANKWVKVTGWGEADEARKEVMDSIARYNGKL